MTSLTLAKIKKFTNGKSDRLPRKLPVATVCSDTRNLSAGCLFVALKGDNFDAHNFLQDAGKHGAVAALVESIPADPVPGVQFIQVDNTRKAMGKLARHVRKTLKGKVIGIGGSNGKTTTKYLIDSILSSSLKGTASPKSFNNDVGVPSTIFSAKPEDDYLILEIGTNHPGEIRTLTHIAQPDIAVITSIGAEHLEGFGDLDGVRKEESALIEGLQKGGTLITTGDDPALLPLLNSWKGNRITFGFSEDCTVSIRKVSCDASGTQFELNDGSEWFVPMLGKHNASNATAAILVARLMNLPDDVIRKAIANAEGPDMRLQLNHVGGISILNDAYNANPSSMKAALDTLVAMPSKSRRIAILGDMRELGESTDALHAEIGAYAASKNLDGFFCIGESSRHMHSAAPDSKHFETVTAAAESIPAQLRPGDLVLIKASRGMKLEQIALAIRNKWQA